VKKLHSIIRTDSFNGLQQDYLVYPDKVGTALMKFGVNEECSHHHSVFRGLAVTMSLFENDAFLPYIVLAWLEDYLLNYSTLADVIFQDRYAEYVTDIVNPTLEKLDIALPYPESQIQQTIHRALTSLHQRYGDTPIYELLDQSGINSELLYRMYVIATTLLIYGDNKLIRIMSHCTFPKGYDYVLSEITSNLSSKLTYHTFDERQGMRGLTKTRTLISVPCRRSMLLRMCIKYEVLQRLLKSPN